ncbi:hypothetical protein J6590_032741, partial [Homalodisca vitripennis]
AVCVDAGQELSLRYPCQYYEVIPENILNFMLNTNCTTHQCKILSLVLCCRAVCVDAGQELSLRYSCQYYEVSAAESFAGVSLAFQSLLREARSVQLLRAMPIRRKLGVNSVSKVLGTIFGKNNNKRDRKKRPSLSI